MNHLVRGAAAALFAAVMFVASLSPALAADIEVIHSEETVQVAPADAWARIGGFCNLADFLGVVLTCEIIAGDGGLGTIRRLELGNGEVVEEPMIAMGPMHYTYAMTAGFLAGIQYHATFMVTPGAEEGTSVVSWTGVFDRDAMPDMAAADDLAGTLRGLYAEGAKEMAAFVSQ
ncbi:MAG: SRPBCC family protein [Rhodospirillales bacterium]|nr:SRPBCC family protein [Rhodospirillales bacterium]